MVRFAANAATRPLWRRDINIVPLGRFQLRIHLEERRVERVDAYDRQIRPLLPLRP